MGRSTRPIAAITVAITVFLIARYQPLRRESLSIHEARNVPDFPEIHAGIKLPPSTTAANETPMMTTVVNFADGKAAVAPPSPIQPQAVTGISLSAKSTPMLSALASIPTGTERSTPLQPNASPSPDAVFLSDPFESKSRAGELLPTASPSPPSLSVGEGEDPDLATFKGIELLKEVGIPIPALSFDYDASDEAKSKRYAENVAKFKSEGMPDVVADLRAQLSERELVGKKERARHSRKRAIVRLVQEARLKKDAGERDSRLQMLQLKQTMVQKQMAEDEEARRKAQKLKEEQDKERDAKVEAERMRVEAEKVMVAKIRMEEVARMQKENEERRLEEKADKKREHESRNARDDAERESKRKMLEEFQAAMQAQMEDQKRLAREDRIKEAQEARESRLKMEEQLGIKKTVPRIPSGVDSE